MTEQRKSGDLFFLVSRAHHNLANKIFGEVGLFRGQPQVLFELGKREGTTQIDMAEKLELTPATLTNLLTRLETAGLIKRFADINDSRCSRIFLTEAGKVKLAQARDQAEKMDQKAFEGFSAEEQNTLDHFLERVHQNLIRN